MRKSLVALSLLFLIYGVLAQNPRRARGGSFSACRGRRFSKDRC